ncbi:hypothetical protein JCM1841_000632 [Sporobolomyces salmonicolor]
MATPSAASAPMAASTSNGGSAAGIETARLLVQKVARGFYGSAGAILVDQLVQKEALRDEELGKRLGMPTRDVAKHAHRLVDDQIISVHRRSEMREGAPKAQQRTYYYMDYSKALDVIKWRMWKIQQTIDVRLRNELDAQGYVCPLCKKSYTPLDAALLFDPFRNILACNVCQTEVVNNENEEEVKGNKDRMQRLNRQTKGIVDLLKKMESVQLPRFDVERWLAIHGPALGATALAAAEANGTAAPSAAVVKVHLAGDDDEALEKAKRERDAEEKRAQNQLPSWIAQSTIASEPVAGNAAPGGAGEMEGASTGLGSQAPGGATLSMNDYKPDLGAAGPMSDEAVLGAPAGDADLDAYYASLENAAPAEVAVEPLPAGGAAAFALEMESAAGTPMDQHGGTGTATDDDFEDGSPAGTGSGKRARSEDEPAEDSGGKKAKLDETAEPAAEEEDEEDEFEELEPGEGDLDPNQLVSVGGKMVPYAEVTEDMTGEMTADEYSAYWDVYQRINA